MRYEIFKLSNSILPNPDPLDQYEYGIEFRVIGGGGMVAFHDARSWMNDVYGWSDQLYNKITNTDNEYWTWQVKHDSYQIFLKSDKELMYFKLKFPVGDLIE
jgi:hypothetical protein